MPLVNAYMSAMSLSAAKILLVGLALVVCAGGAEPAWARVRKHPIEHLVVPSIPRDESGTPIIMQGLPKASARERHAKEPAARIGKLPRSAPSLLPSGPTVGVAPRSLLPVAPYRPPPINSFSDRVMQCNQSFPLNAGLGNNPTTRDAYVRHCVNN
jgi:hypothetical protein